MPRSARPFLLLLVAALSALTLVACGDDVTDAGTSPPADGSAEGEGDLDGEGDADGDQDAGSTAEAEAPLSGDFPVTIESAGGTWTLDDAPERIVSLSPMATELLFAIGAGDQVVAADQFSNYPPEAPTTELSGFDPNIEAITAFDPDLVVIVNDANDLVAGLTALDIPVLVSPAPSDLEQGYDEIALLGLATGRVDETAAVVADLRARMDEAFARAPETAVVIYHEIDGTYYSASSSSFIGAVYAGLGAINIADEADVDAMGFPQLTEEYIVAADPEVIIITDQVGYTAADVLARPAWQTVSAVEAGNVVVVDADTSSRWGPRLPQFVNAVADALASVETAGVGG